MNKYVEKVENYKEKVMRQALEKLKTEYEEAKDSYRDTGYDKYYKKMQKGEEQIAEIEEYINAGKTEVKQVTTSEYKELLKLRQKMKIVKNKVFYLSKELPMCADLINLQDLLRDY